MTAPLHRAAYHGNFKIVQFLIENGADINARRNEGSGNTPLYWVNDAQIAEYLILHKASLDIDKYDTPLNWSVRYKRADVMKVILKFRAPINGNKHKKYPLLEVQDIDCLRIFVENGADFES